MSRRGKTALSVYSLAFSLAAMCIGFGLVGAADLSRPVRFLCNFVFSIQFLATLNVVMVLFRKNSK